MQGRLESYILYTDGPRRTNPEKFCKISGIAKHTPVPLAPACPWPLAPKLLFIAALSLPLISGYEPYETPLLIFGYKFLYPSRR